MKNRITDLFGIDYPIVQGGMIWCSGWKLAAAVSKAGGLGLIGAGSMYPDILREHIQQCKTATSRPFGVNVPLLYPDIQKLIDIILDEQVPVVFTSAGNPKTWTKVLKDNGVKVAHVVSSVKFARKCEEAGVDAVVAEGFEAGGHNGREETTTFCLIPMVREAISLPLLAAGGIGNGRGLLGALALGADGVQIGSRFAASLESSAHQEFKEKIISISEGETVLTLKQLTPVRIIKNKFYEDVYRSEIRGDGVDELRDLLGQRRSKKGMFEGDMEQGELEIGQISAAIADIKPAGDIVKEIWQEYQTHKSSLCLPED
ncbi:MAG: nitronate monooxygenase [Proteobacteria bacterium]|nr:nitronate monooxygenase [Pseudomonadota bacterium]